MNTCERIGMSRFILALALAVVGLVIPGAGQAQVRKNTDCGANTQVLNQSMTANDQDFTAGHEKPCLILRNGVNLDLNGGTIRCPPAEEPCLLAIDAEDAGSAIVQVNIVGRFILAINNPERVTKVLVDGSDQAVVGSAVKKIENSVFLGCAECINVTLLNMYSNVVDNYFRPAIDTFGIGGRAGVIRSAVVSGNGVQVERNYVRDHCDGFESPGTGLTRFTKNIFGAPVNGGAGGAGAGCADIIADGGESFSGNLCSDDAKCPNPAVPFVLP